MAGRKLGRGRRAIIAAARAAGYSAVFLSAAAAGVILHLNLPSSRNFVLRIVNDSLVDTVRGRIHVDAIGKLGPTAVEGVDVTIYDPAGRPVLQAYDVHARVPLVSVIRSVLAKTGPMHIALLDAGAAAVTIRVEQDEAGDLTLAQAFEPVPSPGPEEPGRGVALHIPAATIAHVWAHGSIEQLPVVDISLREVEADVLSSPDVTAINLQPLRLEARSLPVPDVRGMIQAALYLPSDEGTVMSGFARVDVRVGEVPVHVVAKVDGDLVRASVQVERSSAESIRAIVPAIPLHNEVDFHAQVHGQLPHLRVTGGLGLGEGRVQFHGGIRYGERFDGTAQVLVRNVNPADLAPDAPRARVSADIATDVVIDDGSIRGSYEVTTHRTTMDGQVVPPLRTTGRFTDDMVRGTLWAEEDGAEARVAYHFRPAADDPAVTIASVALSASVPALSRIRRVDGLRGALQVKAAGDVRLEEPPVVDARVEVDLHRVGNRDFALRAGKLNAQASGPVDELDIVARFAGRDLRSKTVNLDKVAVRAEGPVQQPLVRGSATTEEGDEIGARARLDFADGFAARDVRATLERNGERITLSAGSVVNRDGVLRVNNAVVRGLGEPIYASFTQSKDAMSLRLRAAGIEVQELAALLGREADDTQGVVTVDADLTARRSNAVGYVDAAFRELSTPSFRDGSGHVRAVFDGRNVKLDVDGQLGDAAKISLRTQDLRIGGPVLSPASWAGAIGDIKADLDVDLEHLMDAAPAGAWPVQDGAGTLRMNLHAYREAGGELPMIELHARTKGLAFVVMIEQPDVMAGEKTPTQIEDIDVRMDAQLDGQSGALQLEGALFTQGRNMVVMNVNTELPVQTILHAPERLAAEMYRTPIQAGVEVPRQRLANLPAFIRPRTVTGDVGGRVRFEGTVLDPKVDLQLGGMQLQSRRARGVPPMDVQASLSFEDAEGTLRVEARDKNSELLTVSSAFGLQVEDIVFARGGETRWQASAVAGIHGLPIGMFAGMADLPIEGCLYGRVELTDLNRDASLEARLNLDKLRVERMPLSDAQATLSVHDGLMLARVRIAQPQGALEVQARTAMTWGADLAPSLDDTKPGYAAVRANNFSLAPLAPLVASIGEIDGRLDGSIELASREEPLTAAKPAGEIHLTRGVLDSAMIGQRLHHIEASVQVSREGTISLSNLEMEGVSGKLRATGTAQFEGTEFRSAKAQVRIPSGDQFPITFQGVNYGEISGRADVTASSQAEGDTAIDVVIPNMVVHLPAGSSRDLQSLEDDPTIEVGVQQPGEFVLLPSARKPTEPKRSKEEAQPSQVAGAEERPTTMRVAVRLGDNVQIRRGSDLRALVRGSTTIVMGGDEPQVQGSFEIPRGFVVIQGRRFDIEEASISLNEADPSNPVVSATATYAAPEDYTITAKYLGTATQGELTLSSDPPLPQSQILALVAFGRTEGPGTASSGGSGVGAAAGLAGGQLTMGLNEALGDVTSLDVTTRIDTTERDPRPEVSIRISRDVTAQVSYRVGASAPGENPDRTMLTIEYHFLPKWSLEASIGDEGTSIFDLLWKHRY